MSKDLTNSPITMNNSEMLIYQAPDGMIGIDTRLEGETVWLTQDHMAHHPSRNSGFPNFYNLDVIISVGYRVKSPGGFPNSLTAESLSEGRSEIRNRVVARVFKELGFIEQWGSSIQRIKNICTAHGLVEPRIRENGDYVDVEFYRPVADSAGLASDTGAKPADTAAKPADTAAKPADTAAKPADIFTRQVQIIMQHLNAHPTISVKVVGELLEIKDSRAREVLQKMTDKSLLEKRGSARSTHYVSAIEMLQRVKI